MYLDLIIFIVLLGLVIFYFRRLSNVVYFLVLVDIFLRLIYFLRINLGIKELNSFLKLFPRNLLSLSDKYLDGILVTIVAWLIFIIYCLFFSYTTKIFLKRRK